MASTGSDMQRFLVLEDLFSVDTKLGELQLTVFSTIELSSCPSSSLQKLSLYSILVLYSKRSQE